MAERIPEKQGEITMRFLRQTVAAVSTALILSACGGGGSQSTPPAPPVAPNAAPTATILASGDVQTAGASMRLTLGGLVRVDGSSSSDPDRDTLSFEWVLVAKPTDSTLSLPTQTGTAMELRPDALGTYRLSLKVSDGKGASNTVHVEWVVDNRAPNGVVVVTPQFSAVATTAPVRALSVGSNVVFDGSRSTDPDGDSLALSYEFVERPAGSQVAFTVAAGTGRFAPDQLGRYLVRVRGSDGRGASFEALYPFDANNRAPTPTLVVSATPAVADLGERMVSTSVGYQVVLDSSTSSDPDGDGLQRQWELLSKPASSTATMSNLANAVSVSLSPDQLGDYLVQLTASDDKGARAITRVRIQVNNRRPEARIGSNATPVALPAAPDVRLPLGTTLTLRGSISQDADGDALTYAWTLNTKPAGATATLSSISVADPQFTPDLAGNYVLTLRVADPSGAFSERQITVTAGDYAPVAVVDRSQLSQLVGQGVRASAALSFDPDGDTLSYQWTVDARPMSSNAALAVSNQAAVEFTPDQPGTYVLAVTVRDARSAAIAYVSVRALPNLASSLELSVKPLHVRYARATDRLVLTSTAPNQLRVIDPFTGGQRVVALPTLARGLHLSADGRLAAVLHEGNFSLVDLVEGTLLRTSASLGQHTDAFVTNAGFVYLIGQSGGQWVDKAVTVFNGRTGVEVQQSNFPGAFANFYGTQYGLMAERTGRAFLMSQGLSPADIVTFRFNAATNLVTGANDSPYHGDYSMSVPLYLNEDESLLFTTVGTYFRAEDLRYAGKLEGVTRLISFSHAQAAEEALALLPANQVDWRDSVTLPEQYHRFAGSLLLPDGALALPKIAGLTSYGLHIFHSGTGRHVMLVQTGSSDPNGSGIRYYIAVR